MPRLCPQEGEPQETNKDHNAVTLVLGFFWICRLRETSKEVLMVPKAGLERHVFSTGYDFEIAASTDFATSALKGTRGVVDYTCHTPP